MNMAPPFPVFNTPHLSNDVPIIENLAEPVKKSAPPPPVSSVSVVEQFVNEHSEILNNNKYIYK
jgi:hypothetical protein